jgi:hypothetical protein
VHLEKNANVPTATKARHPKNLHKAINKISKVNNIGWKIKMSCDTSLLQHERSLAQSRKRRCRTFLLYIERKKETDVEGHTAARNSGFVLTVTLPCIPQCAVSKTAATTNEI